MGASKADLLTSHLHHRPRYRAKERRSLLALGKVGVGPENLLCPIPNDLAAYAVRVDKRVR